MSFILLTGNEILFIFAWWIKLDAPLQRLVVIILFIIPYNIPTCDFKKTKGKWREEK